MILVEASCFPQFVATREFGTHGNFHMLSETKQFFREALFFAKEGCYENGRATS